MFKLEKSALIGHGCNREVYRHPDDDSLCIKVVVSGDTREIGRELDYYRHLEGRGIAWTMLPRYYGEVETSLGPGSVFDLIRDADGRVARTLDHYLATLNRTDQSFHRLTAALAALKNYLLEQRIITMTLMPHNILCRKTESETFQLYIVDNIGNSDYIPICTYSGYFARKKILRKWARFEKRFLADHDDSLLQHARAGS